MKKMKPSGVEWIGDIPQEWEINNAFQIFGQVKNKNIGLRETNLLSLSYGKIKRKSISTVGGLLPENFDGYNIIEANDIVLRLTDLQNDHTSLRVGLATERGIVTSAYLTLRNKSSNFAEYLYYYLHSFDLVKGFYGMGSGVRQGLNWDDLKGLIIILPPLPEQQRIAEFLDRKCAEIDSVISKTKATIEQYKALKQSVITQAVTKGIRPDRPMKDSGIEWIGEIPQEWKISRVKYECECLDQLREPVTADLRSHNNPQYDYYGASGVIDKIDFYNVDDTVLLIGEDGANLVMRNLPLVYKAKGRFWVNNHAHILKPYEHNIYNYMAYLLEAGDYTLYITGSAQPKLSQANLMAFPILHVPTLEQQEIADYLDSKCAEIDRLIAAKEQLLTELESYKKSVIYEYVTGKKEV